MLILFTGFTIPLTTGTAAAIQAAQTVASTGSFVPAPEVIMVSLPISTIIKANLPIGYQMPVVVPPWGDL